MTQRRVASISTDPSQRRKSLHDEGGHIGHSVRDHQQPDCHHDASADHLKRTAEPAQGPKASHEAGQEQDHCHERRAKPKRVDGEQDDALAESEEAAARPTLEATTVMGSALSGRRAQARHSCLSPAAAKVLRRRWRSASVTLVPGGFSAAVPRTGSLFPARATGPSDAGMATSRGPASRASGRLTSPRP